MIDTRERILDPMTAYQTITMMEGVIERGTASRRVDLGRPVAGKTGTTNDNRDAWFVGFTPELVTGIYIGYDDPRSLGRAGSGSGLAAPVFNSYMNAALKDTPISEFHMPEGMAEYRIGRHTGMIARQEDPDTVVEAFKPGTGPSISFTTLGDTHGATLEPSPQTQRALDEGAVGLF